MADYVLFKRYVSLIARPESGSAVEFSQLDAEFSVEKSIKSEPNKCELRIYNLSESNRKALQTLKSVKLDISAGYLGLPTNQPTGSISLASAAPPNKDSEFLIFRGDITQIVSQKNGPDWVTILRTADGVDAIQQSRLNKAFEAGTAIQSAVTDLLKGFKVDTKRALEKIKSGNISGAVKTIINSYVVEGAIYKELQKKFKEWGVDGFISDNELIILAPGEYLGVDPISVTPENGLVGSPEVTTDGYVRFTSLLRPEFLPGYRILVETSGVNGYYRIERVNYSGTTFGNEWYAEIEGKLL